MKIRALARAALGVCAAGAILAGCAPPPTTGVPGVTALSVWRDAALTIPNFVQPVVHPDHRQSFVRPDKGKGSELLYVGDWDTNDVYVYDYPSGKAVGTLTGFSEPYGMCVDAKGDVYISNFGSGMLIEYPPGADKPINTYDPGGEPIGCSVDIKGDVSATSFDPGEVTVYAKGNPKDGNTYSDSSCEYQWAMGYDDKDDLIGVGEYSNIDVCALPAGSKSEATLTEKDITIDFPGGSVWDGKYITLGDQEAGGTYQTGVWPSTLSGTTITAATSEVVFTDTCYSDYTDIVNPFFLGKTFTPVTLGTDRRAKYMIAPNLWCTDAGKPGVTVWHYPSGKPYRGVKLAKLPQEPYGVAVTVKK